MMREILRVEPELNIKDTFHIPSVRKNMEILWKWLAEEKVGTIGIQGGALMGKTWTARKLIEKACEKRLFDVFIWVHGSLNNYEQQMQIVDQLKLNIGENYWVSNAKERNLSGKIFESLKDKKFLLILDDISSYDLQELGVPHPKEHSKASKVLLVYGTEQKITVDKVQKLEKLSKNEAWLLFQQTLDTKSLSEADSVDVRERAEDVLERCKGVPFEIVILAGTLKNLRPEPSSSNVLRLQLLSDIQKASELISNPLVMSHVRFICEMLTDKDVKDCFLFCSIYPIYYEFSVHGLITFWMKSGFLDGFESLEKAYKKGRSIVEELVDRQLLIRGFKGMVSVQTQLINEALEFIANRGFKTSLLKRISLVGGTGTNRKQRCPLFVKKKNLLLSYPKSINDNESSLDLLVFRGSLPVEHPDSSFDRMLNLQEVSLLHLGISCLPTSLSKMNHLNVLLIRGCVSLQNVNQIRGLRGLQVLSLSGALSLEEISDDFFQDMVCLENLDLSDTRLKKLPSSFSNLCNIRFLILSGCTHLETLPSLDNFHQLYLLDLSGSIKFIILPETSGSIRMLDLSGTLVERLPSASNLKDIECLILRGCLQIKTMPFPFAFPQLKVLELSGSSAFAEFEGEPSEIESPLVKLDLSETQIVEVSFLSKCPMLRELLLRSCPNLEMLPSFCAELEVLDLLGSLSIEKFQTKFANNRCIKLDLSRTRINKLLIEAANLVHLYLKECKYLKEIPHLEFPNLQVLNLSGSSNFKRFEDESLGRLPRLEILNLSATRVTQLPVLSECTYLREILLRRCLILEILPELKSLTKLEVLNVSGSTSFKQFQDDSVGIKKYLREINLSGTQVEQLSVFSECQDLYKLILRDCSKLKVLPDLEQLWRLEELDLSGAISIMTLQEQCLKNKNRLKTLDLSHLKIEELPSLSECLNLCHLVLRDCSSLKSLPHLKELTKLELLDLSGDTSFSQFQDESFETNCSLQRLDLSGTKFSKFSFFSRCKNLTQISLRGCSNLEMLTFEHVHNLQHLDLSNSPVRELSPTISKLGSLRHLLLKGCSKITRLPHLGLLTKLEVLDLSGTSIEYPDGISELTRLRYLCLLQRKYLWKFDPDYTNEVAKQLNSDPCGIEESVATHLHLTVSDTGIFSFIEKNKEQFGNVYEKFHFCLCSPEEWGKEKDIYMQQKGFVFNDIYYQTLRIPRWTEEPDRFFKICGFQSFPTGIELVLRQVELLYLKKNDFMTRLSDVGTENVKMMRECWIERCNKMETVFYGEEVKESMALGRSLENLCISYLSGLKFLFNGTMPSERFGCLKHIYLECCPRLVQIFSSHVQLKELQTLKIKFCDQLEIILGEMVLGEQALPKLRTLVLWKLPMLQSICGGVLPSIKNVVVKGCVKLQRIPVDVNNRNCRVKINADVV